ncbi:MAG: hypothetical protein R3185_07360 [Candidatus Thermoplasmatota archaeon]|nr:hypothetical protein [Candidatus Thermoplasmatota archaeon]
MFSTDRGRTLAVCCLMITMTLGSVAFLGDDAEASSASLQGWTRYECTIGPLLEDSCSTGIHKNRHPFATYYGFEAKGSQTFIGRVQAQLHFETGSVQTKECTATAVAGETMWPWSDDATVLFTCETWTVGGNFGRVGGTHEHTCEIQEMQEGRFTELFNLGPLNEAPAGAGTLTCFIEYFDR